MSFKNTTDYTDNYSVCPGCDLLLDKVKPTPGHTVVCPRCGWRLHREQSNSVQRCLALSITGLLLFLPANFLPLMHLRVVGTEVGSSLFEASISMFAQGQPLVGSVVLLTGFFFPFVILSLLLWVSAGVSLGWKNRLLPDGMRWYHHLTEWAMVDVYLIGIFVTIIKISHTATIDFGQGFFCFIALVITTVAAQTAVDKPLFWEKLEKNSDKASPAYRVSTSARTGKEAGLVLCHSCHKTLPQSYLAQQRHQKQRCPRCGEHMHFRKQGSINRTWALLVTAAILGLPANLLPIMEVQQFGQPMVSTIMDGIRYFFQEGSYGIGIIILTASILVPLFKVSGMALILCSIHFNWTSWMRHKSLMFRFIEFIGRWSMLDIFVIALLCALVRFGFLSSISAAPAALYFTGVVLATMFAAISFDQRLLWDITAGQQPFPNNSAPQPAILANGTT